MTIKEFLVIGNMTDSGKVQECLERLQRPFAVAGVQTPATLNDLNMGQLMQLQGIRTDRDFIFIPCQVLLGLPECSVIKSDASEVLGFCYWVAKEVERINKLFASASVPPTPEEVKAGADGLNFGMFGLVDYYALRMGITDHEAVERVPWVRVYKCLDMDARRIMVDRRLRKILMKNNK